MEGSIYDLLMGAPPAASQTADAMARAIRGQQGMQAMGAMAGGGMPGLGQANQQQATLAQQQLEKAAEQRMRYGEEAKNRDFLFKQSQAEMQQRAAMQRELLKAQTGMYKADSALQSRILSNQEDQRREMKDDSLWAQYMNKTNAGLQSSRSVLGADKNTVQRVDRALGLVESKKFLTPNEVADLNVTLAGVLTGGSVAARRTIEEISARTLGMDLAKMSQYMSGNPTDSKAQEFIQRIAATLRTERELAKQRIAATVRTHAIGAQDLLKRRGAAAIDYHRDLGLDDDFLGKIGLDVAGHPDPFKEQRSGGGDAEYDYDPVKGVVPRRK